MSWVHGSGRLLAWRHFRTIPTGNGVRGFDSAALGVQVFEAF